MGKKRKEKSKRPGKTADRKRKRTTKVQRKSQRNGITRRKNEKGLKEHTSSIL